MELAVMTPKYKSIASNFETINEELPNSSWQQHLRSSTLKASSMHNIYIVKGPSGGSCVCSIVNSL